MDYSFKRPGLALPIKLRNSESLKILEARDMAYVDLIELRIDYLEQEEDLEELLFQADRLWDRDIILTLRTEPEGGEYRGDEYFKILDRALDYGHIDFIDIEYSKRHREIGDLVEKARKKGVYTIGSSHNFRETEGPEAIESRLKKMEELDFQILKLAQMARTYEDLLNLLQAGNKFRKTSSRDLILISMGEKGRISRLLPELTDSILSFGTIGENTAAGQMSIRDLVEIRNSII